MSPFFSRSPIAAVARSSSSGGVTDHGALTGLADDDHPQYHTDARAVTWLATRSTSDLPEGSNLYYTDARADARVAVLSATLGTMSIQNANAVAITGGTINGATIGATTPSSGAFTSLSATGNVTIGDNTADTVTVNSTNWTFNNNTNYIRTTGLLTAATSNLFSYTITATPPASGTGTVRGLNYGLTIDGGNDAAAITSFRNTVTVTATTAIGGLIVGYQPFFIHNTASNITSYRAVSTTNSISNTGNATNIISYFAANIAFSSTGAVTTSTGFQTAAFGDALITDSVSFDALDHSGSTSSMRGFRGRLTSGTGKANLYMSGNADNILSGNVRIGSTVAPTVALDVTGSVLISGNTTLGDASADTLTINAGTWTLGSDYTATRAKGALAAGQSILLTNNITASGHAAGTSDTIGYYYSSSISGANAIAALVGLRSAFINTVAATVTAAIAMQAVPTHNSANTLTTAIGVNSIAVIQSTGGITSLSNFFASATTHTGAGVTTTHVGFSAGNLGHANTAGAEGFRVADMSASATMLGYRGQLTSGTGKYNLYMDGSADNYLAGVLAIGAVSSNNSTLRVAKDLTGATSYSSISVDGQIKSDVTATYFGIISAVSTQAAAFALTNLVHFIVSPGTVGAGSSVTSQFGFFVESGMTGATNNFGFYGNLAASANRWNFYAGGTADNAFAGNVRIGSTTAPTVALDVTGAVLVSSTLGVTGHTTFEGVTSTGATGTGALVYATSPTLVTPVIGVATGTSLSLTSTIAAVNYNNIRKTADESVTSSTTLQDDDTLQLAVAANTKYTIRISVHVSSLVGIRWRITGPASPTIIQIAGQYVSTALEVVAAGFVTTPNMSHDSAYHTADQLVPMGMINGYMQFNIVLHNGANAGTVKFTWAQTSSSATATTVRAGSSLEWWTT